MSGKSTAFVTALLKLIFNGTTIPGIADNTATAANTNLFVALHTADPGVGNDQTANEVNYTNYARVAVARTAAGWTVTGASVSPFANIDFPTGTGGSGSATYWSVGLALNGASEVLYAGPLNPSVTLGNGVTPRISSSSTITEA